MVVVVAVAALTVGGLVSWRYATRSDTRATRSPSSDWRAARDALAPTAPAPSTTPRSTAQTKARDAEAPDPLEDDMQTPWAAVDLNALRTELPDNLYWKMASPTSDPAVIEAREAERARWNVEYGKVLSNTATADEVDAYYAHRYRLSSDYVQFATYLLADYGDDLAPRDVGLLKVAIELHLARLEEIPRQITEAHERREAHDAARRVWLESDAAFKNSEK